MAAILPTPLPRGDARASRRSSGDGDKSDSSTVDVTRMCTFDEGSAPSSSDGAPAARGTTTAPAGFSYDFFGANGGGDGDDDLLAGANDSLGDSRRPSVTAASLGAMTAAIAAAADAPQNNRCHPAGGARRPSASQAAYPAADAHQRRTRSGVSADWSSPFDRPLNDAASPDSRSQSHASDCSDADTDEFEPTPASLLKHLHVTMTVAPDAVVITNPCNGSATSLATRAAADPLKASAASLSRSASSVLLGRGAHGTVELGASSSSSSYTSTSCSSLSPPPRNVAVKRVATHESADCRAAADAEMAFAKRAAAVAIAARRDPPRVWRNIAEVLGAGVDRGTGQCTIVCEALGGGTVRAAIAAGTLTSAAAIRSVVRDIAAGLDVLHTELRVLHNDLKLDNVMFCDALPTIAPPTAAHPLAPPPPPPATPRAKIIDFGCSSVLPLRGAAAPQAAYALPQRGALKAMSPERLRGEAYGPAGDVWSLGVCALELARGGQHPFLQPPASAVLGGAAPASPDTFWRLAAALQFVDGPEACAAATGAAVAAAIADSRVGGLAEDAAFADFIARALSTDPSARASARELLQHPWLTSQQ